MKKALLINIIFFIFAVNLYSHSDSNKDIKASLFDSKYSFRTLLEIIYENTQTSFFDHNYFMNVKNSAFKPNLSNRSKIDNIALKNLILNVTNIQTLCNKKLNMFIYINHFNHDFWIKHKKYLDNLNRVSLFKMNLNVYYIINIKTIHRHQITELIEKFELFNNLYKVANYKNIFYDFDNEFNYFLGFNYKKMNIAILDSNLKLVKRYEEKLYLKQLRSVLRDVTGLIIKK